ncbi:Panacea domain-containing protein [Arcanobacterium bovis]|nr:type II toxin-antitoxin system antitoxin SocA domain-containing protein [Arcanobacterium bovis]
MPVIKLQKLVYYSFGWYGRLTGAELFGQTFYAMKHGPVVSELLSLHAGKKTITRDLIESASDDFEDTVKESDPYYEAVLEAVLATYGKLNQWDLRDETHKEKVWIDAWESRSEERAYIDRLDVVDYFLQRDDVPRDLAMRLPEPQVTFISEMEYERIESSQGEYPSEFIRSLLGTLVS